MKINIANRTKINIADRTKINIANRKKINIANRKKINIANRKKINIANRTKINIANRTKINIANRTKIHYNGCKRVVFHSFLFPVSEFTRLEGSFRPFPTRIVQRRQALQTDDFLRLRILHQLEPEIPRVPLTLHRRQAQEGRQRGK